VDREDTCGDAIVHVLTVSRIDPRKGLRCLPGAVALLRGDGLDVELDIIGPVVGSPGETERQQIAADAVRLGVDRHVHSLGSVPLQALLARYRQYDIFVLPTLPGEGIPRVLLEAMAAGLPVVTTRVAGIPSLITHEQNGLLIEESAAAAVAAAVRRLINDRDLRMRLIRGGYRTARAHTLEGQAAQMAAIASDRLGFALRRQTAARA
jgi:glycosyltransferase involved in cell wall biosynthesis